MSSYPATSSLSPLAWATASAWHVRAPQPPRTTHPALCINSPHRQHDHRRRPRCTSLALQSSSMRLEARQQQVQEEEEREETAAIVGVAESKNDGGKKTAHEKQERSLLGKASGAVKGVLNAVMATATLASVLLAAETIWELQGQPLTFANAIPTLTKLLPLTGIGVFGTAQLIGMVARVVRVIVTLPIMVSGTWVILQNVPQLLPKGSDLSGAGSMVAVLATPELLETAAVLAFLGGMVLWAINFTTGAVGAFAGDKGEGVSTSEEDD